MWFIRRILKISWTEKKTNEEVMSMAGYERDTSTTFWVCKGDKGGAEEDSVQDEAQEGQRGGRH